MCRHQTISHGFLLAGLIAVAPERPLAAVPADASLALAAALTVDAPEQVEAAACTYYVPSAVAEQA